MSKEKLTFAIDFDGCLTEYSFPDIGLQSDEQKELLDVLINLVLLPGVKSLLPTILSK